MKTTIEELIEVTPEEVFDEPHDEHCDFCGDDVDLQDYFTGDIAWRACKVCIKKLNLNARLVFNTEEFDREE